MHYAHIGKQRVEHTASGVDDAVRYLRRNSRRVRNAAHALDASGLHKLDRRQGAHYRTPEEHLSAIQAVESRTQRNETTSCASESKQSSQCKADAPATTCTHTHQGCGHHPSRAKARTRLPIQSINQEACTLSSLQCKKVATPAYHFSRSHVLQLEVAAPPIHLCAPQWNAHLPTAQWRCTTTRDL